MEHTSVLREDKPQQVAFKRYGRCIRLGKVSGPTIPIGAHQTGLGDGIGNPALNCLLATVDGICAHVLGDGLRLPLEQARGQGFGDGFARVETENPVSTDHFNVRTLGFAHDARTILPRNIARSVPGPMVDNEQFVAWKQHLQCTPDAQRVIVRMQPCRGSRHCCIRTMTRCASGVCNSAVILGMAATVYAKYRLGAVVKLHFTSLAKSHLTATAERSGAPPTFDLRHRPEA